jgi:integrase
MLEENNVRQGFFEWAEFEKVQSKLPEYLKAPVTFAYITGWRLRSEILKLCWRNVDFAAGTVRLEPGTTKNKDGRLIYMTPQLRALLQEQREKTLALQRRGGQIINLVFHNRGRRIANYYKAWYKACHEAKISAKIPHDFRRTAVRNMVRAGIPERVAMQMTGHKTRAVFDRYHIVSDGDLKEAALKLSALDLTTILTTLKASAKPEDTQVLDFSTRATLAQSVEQLIRNQ